MPPLEGVFPAFGGILGSDARIVLPFGEFPVAAAGGRIASLVYDLSPSSGLFLATSLYVRDVETGDVVWTNRWPGGYVHPRGVALLSDRLYFTLQSDVRVWSASVVQVTLPDGIQMMVLPEAAGRGIPQVSPSGQMLATVLAGPARATSIELFQLASNASRSLTVTGELVTLGISCLVTKSDVGLMGYDLSTGALRWSIPDILYQRGYVTSDGARLVAQTGIDPNLIDQNLAAFSLDALRSRIAVIDLATGEKHNLSEAPFGHAMNYLWTHISGDTYGSVIAAGVFPADTFQINGGVCPLSLLDLSSGALWEDAIALTAS